MRYPVREAVESEVKFKYTKSDIETYWVLSLPHLTDIRTLVDIDPSNIFKLSFEQFCDISKSKCSIFSIILFPYLFLMEV